MKIYDENAIDWAAAARHGISRKMLKESGFLDILLEGGSTPDIPLRLVFADIVLLTDGSITIKEDDIGMLYFEILGVGWH